MQLTLGADLGIVMAKGVALGVICTIVILPSLILFFDKWVEKYRHRTFMPKLTHLSHFVSKHPMPVVVVFILLMIPFGWPRARPIFTTTFLPLFRRICPASWVRTSWAKTSA